MLWRWRVSGTNDVVYCEVCNAFVWRVLQSVFGKRVLIVMNTVSCVRDKCAGCWVHNVIFSVREA